MHRTLPFIALFWSASCARSDSGDSTASADASGFDGASTIDGMGCEPPDVLIVLDRTLTMHRTVSGVTPPDTADGRASSKWSQAIAAIENLVAVPSLDRTIRFGLELFPRAASGCLTLSQRLQGASPTNPVCEPSELLVAPDLGTAAAIVSALEPTTTPLCNSTPAGAALELARSELAARRMAGRPQYVVFVTDGADFADTCPTPDPLARLRELASDGVRTFVVGFGAQTTSVGGVNPPMLNRMACAGETAPNLGNDCVPISGGGYDARDPSSGPRLYIDATSQAELTTKLAAVAGTVCCGCIL